MGEALFTTLSMENNHLSTFLCMDSGSGSGSGSGSSSHDEMERELNLVVNHLQRPSPPDINLPLSAEPSSPPPPSWNDDTCDMFDVGLDPQHFEFETNSNVTKVGKKCAKRLDSVWGAWVFFSFYFKPALNEKSNGKIIRESNGGASSGYDKSNLKMDVFLVQHDVENMYMWVFKNKPENALGKMQLRSYMNGHSRQGESPFPFSVDKGFVRSHKMQRKHYRGLSNPQCLHGIEVVRSPNLTGLDKVEQKKWMELTGRELNFSVPLEACDFGSWRSLPNTEFDLERPPPLKNNSIPHPKRLLNGCSLNLSSQSTNLANVEGLEIVCNKRNKNSFSCRNDDIYYLPNNPHPERPLHVHRISQPWLRDCSGAMQTASGPVTAAKTIYEDDEGFLIIVSMPFVDLKSVKVTWRNTISHGIVKITCTSAGCIPVMKRQSRTFKLADPAPEHCPSGAFVREIPLRTRIPEDATLEAYGDETGTMLEILVPKQRAEPEEHEVRVCLRPLFVEQTHI